MLHIVSALDLFEPDLIDRTRRQHTARFYLDDQGRAWRAVRRRARWGQAVAPAPGEFYGLDGALHKLGRLRSWYREPGQPHEARQRAHLARWRVVRATARRGRETVERFDVLERAPLPDTDAWPPPDVRPSDVAGWTLADATDAARARQADDRAHAARRRQARAEAFQFGTADWTDRDGLIRLVRPSRTTRTATAHYVERAGRWTRTDDPARVWRRRDAVEGGAEAERPPAWPSPSTSAGAASRRSASGAPAACGPPATPSSTRGRRAAPCARPPSRPPPSAGSSTAPAATWRPTSRPSADGNGPASPRAGPTTRGPPRRKPGPNSRSSERRARARAVRRYHRAPGRPPASLTAPPARRPTREAHPAAPPAEDAPGAGRYAGRTSHRVRPDGPSPGRGYVQSRSNGERSVLHHASQLTSPTSTRGRGHTPTATSSSASPRFMISGAAHRAPSPNRWK